MYLLVDIGGTKTRLAVSRDGKTLSAPAVFKTADDFDRGTAGITEQAGRQTSGEPVEAVVVGAPGPLDKNNTTIAGAPNLPGWHNRPLKKTLAQSLDAPVFLVNDADLAGLGEAAAGAGTGHDIVAYLTISTGVGGSRIVNRQLDAGAFGFEPGQQLILQSEDDFTTLEELVSGTGLRRQYGQPAEQISDPAVWDKTAFFLAAGLKNTAVHWSPHCIVLGGSVMKSLPFDRLTRHFDRFMNIFPRCPELKHSVLKDCSALYGGLAYLDSR